MQAQNLYNKLEAHACFLLGTESWHCHCVRREPWRKNRWPTNTDI